MKTAVAECRHRGEKAGGGAVVAQEDVAGRFSDLATAALLPCQQSGSRSSQTHAHGPQGLHGEVGILTGQRPDQSGRAFGQGGGDQGPLGQALGTGNRDNGIDGMEQG